MPGSLEALSPEKGGIAMDRGKILHPKPAAPKAGRNKRGKEDTQFATYTTKTPSATPREGKLAHPRPFK